MSKRLIFFEHNLCSRWDLEQELIMEFDIMENNIIQTLHRKDIIIWKVIFLEMNNWVMLNQHSYNSSHEFHIEIGCHVDYRNDKHTLHKVKKQRTPIIDILPDDNGVNYLLNIRCGPDNLDNILKRTNRMKEDWHYLNKLSTNWSNYIRDENYLIL